MASVLYRYWYSNLKLTAYSILHQLNNNNNNSNNNNSENKCIGKRRFFPLLNAHRMFIFSLVGHGKSVSKMIESFGGSTVNRFDITEKKNR